MNTNHKIIAILEILVETKDLGDQNLRSSLETVLSYLKKVEDREFELDKLALGTDYD